MILSRAQVAAALPGYELGAELGVGGFGLVLAARHRQLGRWVAVKVLTAGGGAGAGFATEARLLAGFDHPHIVRIHDYLEAEGLHLIVMELLAGGTLAQRRTGLAPEGACAAGLAVAEALAYAHDQGVLHRDVKPGNALFDTSGVLKVADFGLAKLVEGSAATASAVVGTVQYMAPEQISCGRLGPTADLYSLGVVVYELLTGTLPFGSDQSLAALVHHHLNSPPAPPAGVPPAVAMVVLRALAKDPAERHPSAQAFALDLAEAAVRSYGTDWVARSGMHLWVGEEVRRVAERPPRRVPAPRRARAEPPRPPSDDGKKKVDAGRDPTADGDAGLPGRQASAPADPGQPDGHGSRLGASPPHRRRRVPDRHDRVPHRRRIVFPMVTVLALAVALVQLLVFHGSDRNSIIATGPDRDTVSRRLASEALRVDADQPDLARRLAVAAFATAPIPEARHGLLATFDHPALATLSGHVDQVSDLAFSPKDAILATASADGTARLWNARSQGNVDDPLATFTDHKGWIHDAAFSRDGKTLATAGDDGIVRLWETAGRGTFIRPLVTFTGHVKQVSQVVFSPKDAILATDSDDGSIRLWDARSQENVDEPLATFIGHKDRIEDMAFSPNGAILATASADGTARLWDATRRRNVDGPLAIFPGHEGRLCGVVFSPDGKTLATVGEDGSALLWDAAKLWGPAERGNVIQPLATFIGPRAIPSNVVFSRDGATLATAGADGTAWLWDATRRGNVYRPLAVFTGNERTPVEVVFSPDGATLATFGPNGTTRLWDAAERGIVKEALATFTGVRVVFSPDSATLAAGNSDGTARIWDLDPGRMLGRACADPANRISAAEWLQYIPELPYDPPCK